LIKWNILYFYTKMFTTKRWKEQERKSILIKRHGLIFTTFPYTLCIYKRSRHFHFANAPLTRGWRLIRNNVNKLVPTRNGTQGAMYCRNILICLHCFSVNISIVACNKAACTNHLTKMRIFRAVLRLYFYGNFNTLFHFYWVVVCINLMIYCECLQPKAIF
jgi:hypothetical protein